MMAWNVRPRVDPSNFMLMQPSGGSRRDALFAMLDCPIPSFRGLQDARTQGGIFGKRPLFSMFEHHDDDMDENMVECTSSQLHHVEKKRRLSVEQVRSLEKSFEMENKLEPERKVHLAQELGLQPRQVAVWFQNRRARWKTKQLEREYDNLKENFDELKEDFDAVMAENQKLKAEVARLNGKSETCKSKCGNDVVNIKTESGEQQLGIEPSQTVQSESITEQVSKKAKDFSTCSDVSTDEIGDAGSPFEQASACINFTENHPVNAYNDQHFLAQFGHVMKYVEADGSYEPFITDLVFNGDDPTSYGSLWD